jgi:hypothetical protein
MKKYEIYNKETNEVLSEGYNEFTAMCNLVSFRRQHGEDKIDIRWIEDKSVISDIVNKLSTLPLENPVSQSELKQALDRVENK